MVRRGSTVRVRQRALQKRRTSALSVSARLVEALACSVLEPVLEPSCRERASVCSGCDRLRRTPPVKSVDAVGSAWINGAPLLPNGPAVGSWAAERQQAHRPPGSWRTRSGTTRQHGPATSLYFAAGPVESTRVLWRDHRRLRTSQPKPMLHASRGYGVDACTDASAYPHRHPFSKRRTAVARDKEQTGHERTIPQRVPCTSCRAALGPFAAFLIVTTAATAAPPAAHSSRRRPPSGGASATDTGKSFGEPEVVVTQQEAPISQCDQLGRRARFGPARFAREAR